MDVRLAIASRREVREYTAEPLPGDVVERILDAGRLAEWDLVLLDLRLPGVGGHEVLEAVRASQDERVRRLPVVVLSHSEVVEDVTRSYDLGANSHIAKPHSLDALFEVVETLGRYWLKVVSLPS